MFTSPNSIILGSFSHFSIVHTLLSLPPLGLVSIRGLPSLSLQSGDSIANNVLDTEPVEARAALFHVGAALLGLGKLSLLDVVLEAFVDDALLLSTCLSAGRPAVMKTTYKN